jgi:hypothetical protein
MEAARGKKNSKYKYSIPASDIDQKSLNRVLSAEFGDQFHVKVDFPLRYFLFEGRPNESIAGQE